MEIVKKNIVSLICAAIALIALIALAWPIHGMYDETANELKTRRGVYETLQQKRTAPRFWPVIPDSAGAPTRLALFPNKDRIDKGNDIKAEVQKQATEMQQKTAENNQRRPLLDNVLPNPGDQRFRYQQAYLPMVQTTLPAELDSTTPPTDADILKKAYDLYKTDFEPKVIPVAGSKINEAEVNSEWQTMAATLPLKMRIAQAQTHKMYLDPGAIAVSRAMLNSPSGPKEEEIWYAQNMLWVQQDLIAAIKLLNRPAKNVMDAPVKQLIHLDIADDQSQYVGGAQNTNGLAGGLTGATPATPDAASGYLLSPTGRISNPLYDVLQFTLVANVDASKVPQIMAELQRGKLITITQINVVALDGIAAADDGYIFGKVPVVTITLKGEELFLRDWTTSLMPKPIKAKLGIQTPADAPANPAR